MEIIKKTKHKKLKNNKMSFSPDEYIGKKRGMMESKDKRKKVDDIDNTLSLGGIGEELLKQMGWEEGKGGGKYEQGLTVPIELTEQSNREGIGETSTSLGMKVEMKLKHYGEEATDKNINEKIKLQQKLNTTKVMFTNLKNEYYELKEEKHNEAERLISKSVDKEEEIENVKFEKEWIYKGIELMKNINENYDELEDCMDALEMFLKWTKSINANQSIIKSLSKFVLSKLIDKYIDLLSMDMLQWKFDSDPKSPYYDVFETLHKLLGMKFISDYDDAVEKYYIPLFDELIKKYIVTKPKQIQTHIIYWLELLEEDQKQTCLKKIKDHFNDMSLLSVCDFVKNITSLKQDQNVTKLIIDKIQKEMETKSSKEFVQLINTIKESLSDKVMTRIINSLKQHIVNVIEMEDCCEGIKFIRSYNEILSINYISELINYCITLSNNSIRKIITSKSQKDVAMFYITIRKCIPTVYIINNLKLTLTEWLELIKNY